jgi:hypothetical protein
MEVRYVWRTPLTKNDSGILDMETEKRGSLLLSGRVWQIRPLLLFRLFVDHPTVSITTDVDHNYHLHIPTIRSKPFKWPGTVTLALRIMFNLRYTHLASGCTY